MAKNQLYLISDIGHTKCKLGVSKNPAARLKQLQTGSSDRLVLLAIYPGSYEDEVKLHNYLCTSRLVGEWFTYSNKIDIILERWESNRLRLDTNNTSSSQ